jgi:mRNA-degrading endonuclease RelE of RelBE toxin-antitoxin system
MSRSSPRHIDISPEARQDLLRLKATDVALATAAASMLKRLASGSLSGQTLEKMPKFGDLSDCRKVYFGYGNPPSHRIVYRIIDETRIEVFEIISVESRDDAYVYLLAALRLQRLPVETAQEYQSVHQRMIASRAAKKDRKS